MAITSNEERTANRLIDLEKRFDQFISQDKPGSQLFAPTYVPFGGSNGALFSDSNFIWDNTNKRLGIGPLVNTVPYTLAEFAKIDATVARSASIGAEITITNAGAASPAASYYAGIRFRSNDTSVNTRSSGRIISGFLAGTYTDTVLILQTADGAETFRDTMTLRGANVGIGVLAPLASLDVIRGNGTDGTAKFSGTTYASHFNYSTTEDTYIRGGKASAKLYLNDVNADIPTFFNGSSGTRNWNFNSTTHSYMSFVRSGTEKFLIGYENLSPERFVVYNVALAAYGLTLDTANNASFFGGAPTLNGGYAIFITNSPLAPTNTPTGGGYLYVSAGSLKYRGSSGTLTTLANA